MLCTTQWSYMSQWLYRWFYTPDQGSRPIAEIKKIELFLENFSDLLRLFLDDPETTKRFDNTESEIAQAMAMVMFGPEDKGLPSPEQWQQVCHLADTCLPKDSKGIDDSLRRMEMVLAYGCGWSRPTLAFMGDWESRWENAVLALSLFVEGSVNHAAKQLTSLLSKESSTILDNLQPSNELLCAHAQIITQELISRHPISKEDLEATIFTIAEEWQANDDAHVLGETCPGIDSIPYRPKVFDKHMLPQDTLQKYSELLRKSIECYVWVCGDQGEQPSPDIVRIVNRYGMTMPKYRRKHRLYQWNPQFMLRHFIADAVYGSPPKKNPDQKYRKPTEIFVTRKVQAGAFSVGMLYPKLQEDPGIFVDFVEFKICAVCHSDIINEAIEHGQKIHIQGLTGLYMGDKCYNSQDDQHPAPSDPKKTYHFPRKNQFLVPYNKGGSFEKVERWRCPHCGNLYPYTAEQSLLHDNIQILKQRIKIFRDQDVLVRYIQELAQQYATYNKQDQQDIDLWIKHPKNFVTRLRQKLKGFEQQKQETIRCPLCNHKKPQNLFQVWIYRPRRQEGVE